MEQRPRIVTKTACMHAYMCGKSLQSCPTLCNPLDHSQQGSSAHGILQAWLLEWVALSSSRGSSGSLWSLLQWQASSLPQTPPGKLNKESIQTFKSTLPQSSHWIDSVRATRVWLVYFLTILFILKTSVSRRKYPTPARSIFYFIENNAIRRQVQQFFYFILFWVPLFSRKHWAFGLTVVNTENKYWE